MICPDLVAHDLSGLAPEGSHAAGGANGPDCLDRRRGRASARRAPLDRIAWVVEPYRTRSFDFTVKHFHEELEKQGFEHGYTWTKSVLQSRGLASRAPKRSAVWLWGCGRRFASPTAPQAISIRSGHLMCYKSRTSSRALDSRNYRRNE